MITANFGAPSTEPGTFDLTGAEENYWEEFAAWCYVQEQWNKSQAGMQLAQPESSDVEAVETAFNNLSDYTKTWLVSAVNASAEGNQPGAFDKNYIPELLSFVGLLVTGNWGAIFVLFVKVGLEFLIDATEKKLDPDVATGDVAEVLRKGLLDENAQGDEYSLLWNIARQQIRILIQKAGDFDDAIFEDVEL